MHTVATGGFPMWHLWLLFFLSLVPPPPTGLNVDPKNSTALLLSWQPLENVPGVLRGYIVTIDQTDNVTLDPNT